MESELKKTPLSSIHPQFGARMVEFGGWWMPVQYQGILQEHLAVRRLAGIFDISHMGEFFISGPSACEFLNHILCNDVRILQVGAGQYTLLLNENGGVIDDLLCYRIEDQKYLLVVNASKIEEDAAWITRHLPEGVTFSDESDSWAGFAIQGPNSPAVLRAALQESFELPARNHIACVNSPEGPLFVARTGYTGEDGFEFFCTASHAAVWWTRLLASAPQTGVVPCGLGARDTLRLEVGYPLNGSDLSPERTPLEAGLAPFVKIDKGEFIGRAALLKQRENGVPSKLVGLVMEGKTPPPRAHYPVLFEGNVVGETSSGSLSPSMEKGIAMAYLPLEISKLGNVVEIDIRGRKFNALVSKRPMYKPQPESK